MLWLRDIFPPPDTGRASGTHVFRAGLQLPESGGPAPSVPPSSVHHSESTCASSAPPTCTQTAEHSGAAVATATLHSAGHRLLLTEQLSVITSCRGLGSVLLKPGIPENPCRSLKIILTPQSNPLFSHSDLISKEAERGLVFASPPMAQYAHKYFAPALPPHHCCGKWEARVLRLSDSTLERVQGPWVHPFQLLRALPAGGVHFLHGGIL